MAVLPSAPALQPSWASPYSPLFRNGDIQTIVGRYWPSRLDEARRPTESKLFATEDDVQVLGKLNRGGDRAVLLAVHGLTACAEAPYMLSLAQRALERGFDTVRLNVRNCGDTEHLCPTLYHSGLTVDLRHVVEALAPRPVFIAGFSMGGNMALKLAGEWGETPPKHVLGVCGISPPIRLDVCSRRIGELRNRVYEVRFLRQLRAAIRRKHGIMPHCPAPHFEGVDSIWAFDERFTAPSFGFDDAADYYNRCSAARFLGDIRVPALVIQAEDDPFIPFDVFRHRAFDENPSLSLMAVPHGGHVAFLGRGAARFWAEEQAIRFFESLLEAQAGDGPRPV